MSRPAWHAVACRCDNRQHPAMPLLYLAIGLAAGLLSGLFGIGGGIIIVPALLLVGRMQPAVATGTSLGSLGPVSEGLTAWLVGIGACVAFAVWIASSSVRSKKGIKP